MLRRRRIVTVCEDRICETCHGVIQRGEIAYRYDRRDQLIVTYSHHDLKKCAEFQYGKITK
jgi:ferredoxin